MSHSWVSDETVTQCHPSHPGSDTQTRILFIFPPISAVTQAQVLATVIVPLQ